MEKEYKKIVVTGDRFVLQLSNQGLLKYFCKHEEKGLCEKCMKYLAVILDRNVNHI